MKLMNISNNKMHYNIKKSTIEKKLKTIINYNLDNQV